MTTRTLVGPVTDRLGHARWRGWALPSLEYRAVQPRVPVRIEHGDLDVGRVEHLELDRDGRLIAVCKVDCNIVTVGDWWFSSGVTHDRHGHDIEMVELSITKRPAIIGLRPITTIDGDFTRSWHRTGMTRERHRLELLERAADTASLDAPITIRSHDEIGGQHLEPVLRRLEHGATVRGSILRVS